MILARLLPILLLATMMSTAQESLTINLLPIPFPPEDKPLCVSVSEDGNLAAYQSRRTDGKGGADIWMSRRKGGRWSAPYNAGSGINTEANEVDAKLSPDGKTVVFIRGKDFKVESSVYVSHFRNGRWSEAEVIGPPISLPGTIQFGAIITRDGKRLYFASNRPGGLGSFDIYYSDRTADGWGSPVNLGAKINTTGADGDVAVAPDGRTMIFPSERADTLGESDLYISRFENNSWLEPANLGPRFNTSGNESCPWLGYDGKTLYLNSDWDKLLSPSRGQSRIWQLMYEPGFSRVP
jgi:Tol biopolymer transport system component